MFSLVGCLLTDHRLNVVFHYNNELKIDANGQVTQNLPVFREIEMLQVALMLLWSIRMAHEFLKVSGGAS